MWYYKRRVDFSAYCNKFPLNARQSILCQNQVLVPIPVASFVQLVCGNVKVMRNEKEQWKEHLQKGAQLFFHLKMKNGMKWEKGECMSSLSLFWSWI